MTSTPSASGPFQVGSDPHTGLPWATWVLPTVVVDPTGSNSVSLGMLPTLGFRKVHFGFQVSGAIQLVVVAAAAGNPVSPSIVLSAAGVSPVATYDVVWLRLEVRAVNAGVSPVEVTGWAYLNGC